MEEDAKATGVDRSKYLRALVQGSGNADIRFPEDRAKLIRQVSGIATNINQIAKVANERGDIYYSVIYKSRTLLEAIQKLIKEVLEEWQLRKS